MYKDLIGLILMGGKSSRMGQDKAMLLLHDKPLYVHALNKLSKICANIYLSTNSKISKKYTFNHPEIVDIYDNQGPLGAILSAFETLKSDIIILACDMPFIDDKTIEELLSLRDLNAPCTMFYCHEQNHYEPMLSIWEYALVLELQTYFSNGGRSLQKFCENHNIAKHTKQKGIFSNINTPQDFEDLKNWGKIL